MPNDLTTDKIELICAVVDFGLGSKVLHKAKKCGVKGGTIFLGKGTVNSSVLKLLEIRDIRKEIVLLVTDNVTVNCALSELDRIFKFEKPNHGIVFTTSIAGLCGTRCHKCTGTVEERSEENTMYQAITIIVDKGKAEQVVEAATKAGSRGGTIINARGSGIHETSKLFAMDIEPLKEIVLILSDREKTRAIVGSIRESLKIEEPGNGIIFTQDLNQAIGLFE